MLSAIETSYHGYLFRSRLEARWAVFFHEAGVPYRYEREGFELPGDMRYLPDFWLPDIAAWVEIKPNERRLLASKTKLEAFAAAASTEGQRFYVLVDDPYPLSHEVWRPNQNGALKKSGQRFTQCEICGLIDLLPPNEPLGIVRCSRCGERDALLRQSPAILNACAAARQARFE